MPSFGELIASSMPDKVLNIRRDQHHFDSTINHFSILSIDTFPFSKLAATTPEDERPYSLPPAPRSLRRSSRAKPPHPRVVSKVRKSVLLKKPLPTLPVTDASDDSDDCSLPDLSNSADGASSRRSSADSFSYLDRARSEIDLLLGTLKPLPVADDDDDDTEMYADGGVQCIQFPGMWREEQYAPFVNINAYNSSHATTSQRLSQHIDGQPTTSDVRSPSLRSSSPDVSRRRDANSHQDYDKIVLSEPISTSLSPPHQSMSLVARWRQSGSYADSQQAVYELPTDQHPKSSLASPVRAHMPAMDSLSATQSRAGSATSSRSGSFVSPISSDISSLNFGKPRLAWVANLAELPASMPNDTATKLPNNNHQASYELPIAELPADNQINSDPSLEELVRRNNSVTSQCASLQHQSSVYESRRISQTLLAVPSSSRASRIASSPSDTSIPAQGARRWKGKERLIPIKTSPWDEIPPQTDVQSSRNAPSTSLNMGTTTRHYTITNPDIQASPEEQDAPDNEALPPYSALDPMQNQAGSPSDRTATAQQSADAVRIMVPQAMSPRTTKNQRTSQNQPGQPQPAKVLALQNRIESMNKRMSENEARLQEEFDAMISQFKRESEEVSSAILEKQEAEAVAATAAVARLNEALELQDREAELAQARALLRVECVVCGDEKDPEAFPSSPPTSRCQHECKICAMCLDSWVSSTLKENGTDNIKCPECPEKLQYEDVQLAASPITFEAYDKAATLFALSSLPEFAWCLAPNCGYGQLNVANNNYMECVSCGYKQCLKHQQAWHKGETCEQHDARAAGQKAKDEAKTLAILDNVSKACPGEGCGWRIQKIDGCDHITCRRCKHEFCWLCLASHKEIKRIGNTAHAKDCKFHSENLELTWPFNRH